eukprot:1136144-Pelagomonas_calceolata.AAC.4
MSVPLTAVPMGASFKGAPTRVFWEVVPMNVPLQAAQCAPCLCLAYPGLHQLPRQQLQGSVGCACSEEQLCQQVLVEGFVAESWRFLGVAAAAVVSWGLWGQPVWEGH